MVDASFYYQFFFVLKGRCTEFPA